jgi:hypothetical protein
MSNGNSRDEWDAMWEVTRRPVCDPAERDEHTALRAAVAAERAAVVAWLRREATDGFVTLRIHAACAAEKLADAIERGEHRREEGE